MGRQAGLLQPGYDLVDVAFTGTGLHDYDHADSSWEGHGFCRTTAPRVLSSVAPPVYTWTTSPACLSVLHIIITRRHRERDPGTSISCPHISGTVVHPISRAATAGNSAFRSRVVVNKTQAMSSGWRPFASTICFSNSCVAASMCSLSFCATVVAPRMPLHCIVEESSPPSE